MGIPHLADTIFGLASGAGVSGVAVVRVSGPLALRVGACLVPALGRSAPARRLRLSRVVDPGSGELLDRGLVVFLPGPGSYTAEDVVELHLHGGPAVVSSVLDALGRAGGRLAQPGEFTLRAFLNGRIDLAEAEAVAGLVEARSGQARRVALRQLDGGVRARVEPLRGELVALLAELEASLDFPEEELGILDRELHGEKMVALDEELAALLEESRLGRRLREGARVVLSGRPNVGKSSLLNALVGRDRAIVHPSPGTTRDYLEDVLLVGGVEITIVDTAGQRLAVDPLEGEGVERAQRQVKGADLVLHVINLAEGVTEEDKELVSAVGEVPLAVVLNHRDRVSDREENEARRLLGNVLAVTVAPLGIGIPTLKEGILRGLGIPGGGLDELPSVTEARHVEALAKAKEKIKSARDAHQAKEPEELVALELRQALEALGSLLGEGVGEAILEEIFSRFCLGK